MDKGERRDVCRVKGGPKDISTGLESVSHKNRSQAASKQRYRTHRFYLNLQFN